MSNKKISIHDMEKSNLEFKKSHYVSVSGFKPETDKIPAWFKKFHEEEFVPLRDAFIKSQTEAPEWFIKFANEVMARFDKQEQFNNFVLDQFKKHGWIG